MLPLVGGEGAEQATDRALLVRTITEGHRGVDLVAVAPADPGDRQVPSLVRSATMPCTVRSVIPDLDREIAQPDVPVAVDRGEDLEVVGEEATMTRSSQSSTPPSRQSRSLTKRPFGLNRK